MICAGILLWPTTSRNIAIVTKAPDTKLHIDVAITLGLLVNELVSNAIKHAFPSGDGGNITVRFMPDSDGGAMLTVADDGMGPPGDAVYADKGIGMQIIDGLVAQLRAGIAWHREGGTTAIVTLPTGFETGDAHD